MSEKDRIAKSKFRSWTTTDWASKKHEEYVFYEMEGTAVVIRSKKYGKYLRFPRKETGFWFGLRSGIFDAERRDATEFYIRNYGAGYFLQLANEPYDRTLYLVPAETYATKGWKGVLWESAGVHNRVALDADRDSAGNGTDADSMLPDAAILWKPYAFNWEETAPGKLMRRSDGNYMIETPLMGITNNATERKIRSDGTRWWNSFTVSTGRERSREGELWSEKAFNAESFEGSPDQRAVFQAHKDRAADYIFFLETVQPPGLYAWLDDSANVADCCEGKAGDRASTSCLDARGSQVTPGDKSAKNLLTDATECDGRLAKYCRAVDADGRKIHDLEELCQCYYEEDWILSNPQLRRYGFAAACTAACRAAKAYKPTTFRTIKCEGNWNLCIQEIKSTTSTLERTTQQCNIAVAGGTSGGATSSSSGSSTSGSSSTDGIPPPLPAKKWYENPTYLIMAAVAAVVVAGLILRSRRSSSSSPAPVYEPPGYYSSYPEENG